MGKPVETQESMAAWHREAIDTPGRAVPTRLAIRANEEMAELLRALALGRPFKEVIEECADVVIVLSILAERMGVSLADAVDAKMAINRAREWEVDGSGCARHKKA